MFPVLFAIPRTSGWIAQWLEMIEDNEQKIARPRQIYTGERTRDYVAGSRAVTHVWAITKMAVATASATPPAVNSPTVWKRSGMCPPVRSACSSARWRCAPVSSRPTASDA